MLFLYFDLALQLREVLNLVRTFHFVHQDEDLGIGGGEPGGFRSQGLVVVSAQLRSFFDQSSMSETAASLIRPELGKRMVPLKTTNDANVAATYDHHGMG